LPLKSGGSGEDFRLRQYGNPDRMERGGVDAGEDVFDDLLGRLAGCGVVVFERFDVHLAPGCFWANSAKMGRILALTPSPLKVSKVSI
jgi:hypothetical protein